MHDTLRRRELASRSRDLRCSANAIMDQLEDAGVKSMMRGSVLHPLDDVDSLFLADPEKRPTTAVNEAFWLDHTEFVLSLAEQAYKRLLAQIEKFGGPKNVRSIG